MEKLVHAAAQTPDVEVCGLLVGNDGAVQDVVMTTNTAADPSRSFEIDPAALLRTHREARGGGMAVIGHWHSHPNGVPSPSARDAARALDNGQIWLIVAGGAVQGWIAQAADPMLMAGRFAAVTLVTD
ncbi:M67 family metallopeptidase [Sandarakinorhabdus sp.]|uniref:M67 family metallopeptidase n=1 Tax=Sandarakinorhabdus sp. TaxID=1916663 RepID=UPI00286DF93D|nr:M67 family metallopeptidase [Sandarakinorhabdus sp.]